MRIFHIIIIIFFVFDGCKKDDNSPTEPAQKPFDLTVLSGKWKGTFKNIVTQTADFTIDEQGNLTGTAANTSVTGKWTIDNTGKVTGSGVWNFEIYSKLYDAACTWDLQMNKEKNQLTGTWDIQVPYSTLRDMQTDLSKQ